MKNFLLRAALIPVLFGLLGLHARRNSPDVDTPRTDTDTDTTHRRSSGLPGRSHSADAAETRTRIADARVQGPPRREDIPAGDRSHGPREKRERRAEEDPRPNEGPVWFNPPKKMDKVSPEQLRQAEEYVNAANDAYYNNELSPTGRVATTKDPDLEYRKEQAAEAERNNPEDGQGPYGDKVAAHLPDTTWTGNPDPAGGWGRHDSSINGTFGSQSGLYPEGWKPKPGPVGVQPFNLHPDWYSRLDPTL
ncbi:hypothetical protein SAMN05216298_1796 [Glycomyces sambucus]|uniref:Colicin import membrane protein n=1 Tax=Glycomyces sambucus TaxID=380244 RepID=A0A1G9FHC2_9ACTN|nr:hypothetical protein [Glycomyces sambucus]SDK87835.1 hypothetical protein SAMN05216298_1796 [Glycomyces sambucus]